MIFFKKTLLVLSFLLFINAVSAQSADFSIRTNPLLELGVNAQLLRLKGSVKEMQEHKFTTDIQGRTTNDSASVSNQYRFDQNGLIKEIEETFKNSLTKKSFFSYTNKGFVSHIDIETTILTNETDTTGNAQEKDPIFSAVDYKYVQKKNILFKGEDLLEGMPKKVTARKEYFYHFNDYNQIFQIDYQTTDLVSQYNYDSNGLIKESLTSKSGVAAYKTIYKYDRNNRVINMITINSGNTTKFPNQETVITYKLDSNGNAIEKKIKNYQYSPKGTKEFMEGYLYLYNYTYL
ncbi:hypothetical protein [Flavobacterium aquicola]|uniref:YD repeat-containing protein n=1 Tax=Flavobacterium aquicola TaxID=1682742 RepID=A0A3E0EV26_9FLAO|nr:hypothetical protein [Flavobacterium aquicola]REH01674.1 hypothetical protein C8P67_101154 [Flavobacterium aquicola]